MTKDQNFWNGSRRRACQLLGSPDVGKFLAKPNEFQVRYAAMIITTNLATHPYTNRRRLSLGLGFVILIGSLLGGQFRGQRELARVSALAIQTEVQTQDQQIKELQKRIPPPVTPDQLKAEERELLVEASALIEQRLFPWSRFLREVEAALGPDVRVTRVNVALEDPSAINPLQPGTAPMKVSMVLIGKQLDDVLGTMATLRETGRFSDLIKKKQTALEGTQEIEYEVEVRYRLRHR